MEFVASFVISKVYWTRFVLQRAVIGWWVCHYLVRRSGGGVEEGKGGYIPASTENGGTAYSTYLTSSSGGTIASERTRQQLSPREAAASRASGSERSSTQHAYSSRPPVLPSFVKLVREAMRLLASSPGQIILLAAVFVIVLCLWPPTVLFRSARPAVLRTGRSLGVASNIFVISLRRRMDRRSDMLKLADTLRLDCTWVDATDANHPNIDKIMQHVRAQRHLELLPSFKPGSFKDVFTQSTPDGLFGSDLWTVHAPDPRVGQNTSTLPMSSDLMDKDAPIPCTKGSPFRPLAVPPGKPSKTTLLSRPMIACWHSHLQVIHRIVRASESHVSIVFEDDVDLEWDVEARLVALWPSLPQDWDIVFLGSSHSPRIGSA